MDHGYTIHDDDLHRIAAVVRRLYSQTRMDGDCMRDAAQMLDTVLERLDWHAPDNRHATYDARLNPK